MGILNLLTNQGSQLSKYNGETPNLVASTPQSKLHGTFDGDFGYSTEGFYYDEVNAQWQAYDDGMVNPLPQPSQLDKGTSAPIKYEQSFIPSGN